MKKLLLPFAWLYRAITSVRNICYDNNWFRVRHVSVPVISVGNLSVGGTGKTPLVKYIANRCIQSGYTVAIISRGYKRKSRGQVIVSEGSGPVVPVTDAGDEPYMLSYLIPESIVIVDADRVAAAQTAIKDYHAEILIMDDGFQHRRLGRDYNIVVVPVQDVLNHESVMPAGRLRESWNGLRRASHIILTGASDANNRRALQFVASRTDARIISAEKQTQPVLKNPLKDLTIDIESLDKAPDIFALAGIGNPEQFRLALEKMAVNTVHFEKFPDHYYYSNADQRKILADFSASGAEYLVITAKDFVKWEQDFLKSYPIFYLPLEYSFSEDIFADIIKK
ncbi:MAG: tetraacyldisaccharide 4'-kinase [Candidatus Marinimicrobia bacterium]|nr:tetraacyldisaccharide 4'-kinase [Candidatus Neomarinimicrobiota bacterium]